MGNEINEVNLCNRCNRITRSNHTYRHTDEISEAYREYVKRSGKVIWECIDRALTEDMKNNPVETVILEMFNISEVDAGVQHRLRLKRLTLKIQEKVELLDALEVSGLGDPVRVREDLGKLVDKAVTVNNPSKELIHILEKVETYFE